MFCITLDSTDPFFNLAIEEILFKGNEDEFLILGINSPSVIIGKHQSAHREINTRFITENKIPVIRRISGGGTVYHDTGNLNFTFILQSSPGKQVDFPKYTKPVIDFLSSLGIHAAFEGKNDIKVNGLKISGNAEHVRHNRVLHHGTLLFSSSLEKLRNSIRKDKSCYITRAVDSNPSPVTNLDKLTGLKDITEFRSSMMNYFMNNLPDLMNLDLNENEIKQAESLADNKYRTWEWNWAYGPEYQFINQFESAGIQVQCKLSVEKGIIVECLLLGSSELVAAGKKLIGCRHMVEDFTEVFRKEGIFMGDNDIYNFF
jgi:lipoate---protein ligase